MSEVEIYKGMVKKMKDDEIKEILDDIKDYSEHEYLPPCCELTNEECKHLLDYITDLQQENEDYKSRCEKAVEKIKKIQQNAIKYGVEHDVIICQELIDGLNGRSDE